MIWSEERNSLSPIPLLVPFPRLTDFWCISEKPLPCPCLFCLDNLIIVAIVYPGFKCDIVFVCFIFHHHRLHWRSCEPWINCWSPSTLMYWGFIIATSISFSCSFPAKHDGLKCQSSLFSKSQWDIPVLWCRTHFWRWTSGTRSFYIGPSFCMACECLQLNNQDAGFLVLCLPL